MTAIQTNLEHILQMNPTEFVGIRTVRKNEYRRFKERWITNIEPVDGKCLV
jgi:hypothetical protein